MFKLNLNELKNKTFDEHKEEIKKVLSLDKARSKTYESLLLLTTVLSLLLVFSFITYKVYDANKYKGLTQFERTLQEAGFNVEETDPALK